MANSTCITSVSAWAQDHPVLFTTTLIILASLTLATLRVAYQDYRSFVTLDPHTRGGIPYDFYGWLLVTFVVRPLSLSARDKTYTGDLPREGASAVIVSLPDRWGPRAETHGVVPHRQVSQLAPEPIHKPLAALLSSIAASHPSLLTVKRSHYEFNNDALYVHPDILSPSSSSYPVPPIARIAQGEIAHIHFDHSLHVYLHPADARLVIEKGWGERHRLGRTQPWWLGRRQHVFGLGHTLLMLYGPRDEKELEVVRTLVGESWRWMVGRRQVKSSAA